MATLIWCLPASAQQTRQNWGWCANAGNIYSSDFAINACTSIIMDGKQTNQSVALVYANRCREFFSDQMETLALQDCNESMWLDRRIAYSFVIRGNVYAKMQKYDRAADDYNEAIGLAPDLEPVPPDWNLEDFPGAMEGRIYWH